MTTPAEWEYFKSRMPDVVAVALTRAGMRTIFNTTNIIYSEVSGQWIIREPGGKGLPIGLVEIGGHHEPAATLELAPWVTQEQKAVSSISPGAPSALGSDEMSGTEPTRKTRNECETEQMCVPPSMLDCMAELLLDVVKSLPAAKKAALQAQALRLIGLHAEYRTRLQRYHQSHIADQRSVSPEISALIECDGEGKPSDD